MQPANERAVPAATGHGSSESLNGKEISSSRRLERQCGGVRLIPFDDIVLSATRRDLVKGLIPRVGLAVIWGPPKCGKSFLVFDLSMHVALGRNYRGRRVHQGPVVYCAFEGQAGMKARKAAFKKRFLQETEPTPPFYLQPMRIDLVEQRDELEGAIRDQLGDTAPVLIVLDTLNRSINGSESDDKVMSAYINAADKLREAFECAVLIVHHCGIDASRPRGHTSLTGAVETQIAVRGIVESKIMMEVELAKDGPQGDQIFSALQVVEVGTDEDGGQITSCVVIPNDDVPSTRNVGLTRQSKLAMDLLTEVIKIHGHQAQEGDHFPKNTLVVPVSLWRKAFYERVNCDRNNPETSRKAFRRARSALEKCGHIEVRDDYVWRVLREGTNRTSRDFVPSVLQDQSGTDRDTPQKGVPLSGVPAKEGDQPLLSA